MTARPFISVFIRPGEHAAVVLAPEARDALTADERRQVTAIADRIGDVLDTAMRRREREKAAAL